MNRRCLVRSQRQWFQLPVKSGPFHRQYRAVRELSSDRNHRQLLNSGGGIVRAVTGKNHLSQPQFVSQPEDDLRSHRIYNRSSLTPDQQPTDGLPYLNGAEQHRSVAAESHNSSAANAVPMRLLWFRMQRDQRPKVTTLLDRFDHAGMDVEIIMMSGHYHRNQNLPQCALIMLECVESVEHEMLAQLNEVRATSKAPLIVLTDNHTLDWSLLALREGADAIFTLNTPDDIILARSTALIRRWLPK